MNNKFSFVAPMFNASSTLEKMLHSIAGQSYLNWRLILVDDVSDPSETMKELAIISAFERFGNVRGKIKVILNREKKWETRNVLNGIKVCDDNDIICRIDADDSLCDLDALAIMNSAYVQTRCDVAWSNHRWGQSDRNISAALPDNADPYKHRWVTSHLKTFRKHLLNNVSYDNFTNMSGDLVKRCGDQAIYLPVLHSASKRVHVPRSLYSYTIDEQNGAVYQTDDAKFQKNEADFIRARGFQTKGQNWENVIK